MSANAVLNAPGRVGEDEINDGMAGVLCRCTGHIKVKEAIRSVVEERVDIGVDPEVDPEAGPKVDT